jgi:hypothetical protein
MRTAPLALLLGLGLLFGVAGCGGSDDSTDSATTTATSTAPEQEKTQGGDPAGGAQQFEHRGSDNSIQESGHEAETSEREEAAIALHGYLDAGVRRDWKSACRYLAKRTYEQVAVSIVANGKPCPGVLAAFFSRVPTRSFVLAAKADVGAFRVEGAGGYLLYHGAEGVDYQMPMALNGGSWKVAAVAGSSLY